MTERRDIVHDDDRPFGRFKCVCGNEQNAPIARGECKPCGAHWKRTDDDQEMVMIAPPIGGLENDE